MDRRAYVESQGYCSYLLDQPNCSVIQGSKLSATLYTINTPNVTEIARIMENPKDSLEIVGKPKVTTYHTQINGTGYIDDIMHMEGGQNEGRNRN